MKTATSLAWLGLLLFDGCEFNITNPNSPTAIGPNPSRPEVAAAATGLLIGARQDATNWVLKASIIGREAYRLDVADPRFVTELLVGPLDPSNAAFGGGQWAFQYRTIKSGYDVLNIIGTASQLSAQEQAAVSGFTRTMQAYAFLILLDAHTEDSIPIDVNRALDQPLAPLVTNQAAWGHVVDLLDSAKTDLQAGGSSFPFSLPSGLTGFDTPATFLKFNRALLARVQAYRASPNAPGGPCATCWDDVLTALSQSFMDTTKALDVGVYHSFSTGPGDITNALSQDPTSAVNLVHPLVRDSAETQQASSALDKRYLAKVTPRGAPLSNQGLTSDLSWIRYPTPSSPVPIIRNEELILIAAEAYLGKGDRTSAATLINFIRVKSGGLAPVGGLDTQTPTQILDQLLKQRLYSLMYEGGHRWIDMRRYGRLNQIKIDRAGDQVFATFPINVNEALARQ